MNNMGFFNPFGSSGSGGGGGGSTANYSVKTITDSSGQVSYKLTKNGTAVGDVISFNGSNMLVSYGGELVVLNSAITGIEEALDKTYNFTTFTELGINTQNKTLSQLSAELAAKNLEEGTVVTGRVYSEALPYNNYGNAEVLVNNSILWWKTSSSTISPYSWNAIVVGNTVKMDWTPTYYQLPIASAQSLGGVKIGDNVQIAPDGTISVITTKGDTGTGIASIAKTSSSGLNDIYTITYTDSTTSTFTVTNGATITGGSIGQTGHLILTMSDGRTIDAGALPTDNEVEVTTTSSQPADPNVELWVDLSTQQTLSIPEINDSSTSSIQDTWSCKKIYDEQQRQEEEIGVIANAGAKNDFDIENLIKSAISENVTYSLSGYSLTASSNGRYARVSIPYKFKAGTTVFSTVVSGYSISGGTMYIRFATQPSSVGQIASEIEITNNGQYQREITVNEDTDGFVIYYMNGSTDAYVNSAVFTNNMIRPASITDDTFVPYAKTNRELTVAEDEDRAALIEQVDSGAKNLFDISVLKSSGSLAAGSHTSNGVTYTLNSDGTISLSGTATSNSTCSFVLFNSNSPYLSKFAGKELSGGLSNKVYLAIEMATSPYTSLATSQGGANTIAAPDNTKQYLFYIRVMRGENVDGKVISPMICTAADYAVSPKFVPYRPSWQELAIKEQQNENNILLNTKYGGGRNVGNFAYYGLNPDQSIAAGTITHTESNGEFTFTGAADSSKNYACYLLKKQLIKAGNYVISGISGGSTSTYWFRIGTGVSDTFKMNVTDSGTTLTLDSDTKITLQLVVKSGVSLSNKVFSPMIITAADWANSHDFQQYGESNAQLSSIVQADIDNMTEFKFAKLDELNSSVHFKYGFLIGGGGASSPNKVMLWHIFVNTSNSVYFTKIIGDDTMTLTGSISDGVLTITSSATIYGGLRLIWLG